MAVPRGAFHHMASCKATAKTEKNVYLEEPAVNVDGRLRDNVVRRKHVAVPHLIRSHCIDRVGLVGHSLVSSACESVDKTYLLQVAIVGTCSNFLPWSYAIFVGGRCARACSPEGARRQCCY